jgi:hypothetical protein
MSSSNLALDSNRTNGPAAFDCDSLSDADLQLLLESAVRSYAARLEAGSEIQPFSRARAVSATEVMTVVSRILKSTGIEVFELGMWQAWTGGK